jgi:Flp pilus assembly protein TadG
MTTTLSPIVKRSTHRRGIALVYVPFMMVLLLGLASFGVDWGRVQMAKTQLLSAADAAARAAALKLSNGAGADAITAAMTIGGANTADGSSVTLQAGDVELGTWNSASRTFTPLSGSATANAVRVTARRLASRGNPVRLAIASMFGRSSCDVSAQAIAVSTAGPSYGIIGLDQITMSGNTTDSYNPTTNGSNSGGGCNGGGDSCGRSDGCSDNSSSCGKLTVATNGQLSISGNTRINGDACYGSIRSSGNSGVSGASSVISQPLSYPNGNAGSAATQNNDYNVPAACLSNGNLTLSGNNSIALPGGTYYFNNVSISGNASVMFLGKATIYVTGSLNLSGNANTSGNDPANLSIVLCPNTQGQAPASLSISGNGNLYADIYAPQSAISLSGNEQIYGRVLGKTIAMSGNASIHVDTALTGSGGVMSVK